MGWFSFGKDKTKEKETLDKGLVKTKENLLTRLTKAIAGRTTIDDSVLDDLEETLISSDVGV